MIFVVICILLVFGLAVAFTCTLLFIEQQTRSGEFIEELPLELVPTAEYLLNHPLPTPVYLSIDDRKLEGKQDLRQICVIETGINDIFGTSRFFMNGTRLPNELIRRSTWSSAQLEDRDKDKQLSLPAKTWSCISLALKRGLHLIEFQPSVWSSKPHYQWAIEIK
jgi:hypothetical protein